LALAIGQRARVDPFRGLEQFDRRGGTGDIGYCIAGPTPYALEFTNDSDVICLLLGDISTETKFEDDKEKPLLFLGQSAAFHPRGGNVRVRAADVRHGFIAFSYSPNFQQVFDDVDIDRARRAGSRNNIRKGSINALSRYALGRLRSRERLKPFEIQSLASLVYLETIRCMGAAREDRRNGLSDSEFAAICEFIDAELGNEMSCAKIAAAAGVPLRVVFDGMRMRTGMSPYRYVIEKRLERAREMLKTSKIPISEIALVCGFSSQQHLTSTLSSRLGTTPQKIRMND
jgi:AraC family transcriptional regulator